MRSGPVAVAGATGSLGRQVVQALRRRGVRVRALGRDEERLQAVTVEEHRICDLRRPASLAGVLDGMDAVVVCSGASMAIGRWRERGGFLEIDERGNTALLAEGKRAGVRRFVYVSLAGALALRHTEYALAHERFVNNLQQSGLSHCVVRPTGLFSIFQAYLDAARRGPVPIPGDGRARTNPIHEADVAEACVQAISTEEAQMIVGGPEVFSRRRMAELAFESLGRPPQVYPLPAALFRTAVPVLRLVQPRLAALVEFGVAVCQVDVIAPAFGQRRLGDYLRALAVRR